MLAPVFRYLAVISALGGLLQPGTVGPTPPSEDPLAAEIARWTAYVRDNKSTDELWTQSKDAAQPVLVGAADALSHGWRHLALQRLAAARVNLAASRYVLEMDGGRRQDPAALEAEWKKVGGVLAASLEAPSAAAFEDMHPAAVRAVAEASLIQVGVFYNASLVYARSTSPDSGYYYLGTARAQSEIADLCRRLSVPPSGRMPPLRGIARELDALETELLAAYKPPASLDKHREFIIASAALKEARELDAAGLRHGALLRYLQTNLRLAPLRPAPEIEPAVLAARLDAFERRLSESGVDHSIGLIFLQAARADAANAAALAADVLPRYFAAFEPAAEPAPAMPPAQLVTVTLVRWPYT